MNDKEKKILDILAQVQELYPQLDRLMVNDFDNPSSIIFTSEGNLEKVANDLNIDLQGTEYITEEDEFEAKLELLEWSEDDDEGGLLQ